MASNFAPLPMPKTRIIIAGQIFEAAHVEIRAERLANEHRYDVTIKCEALERILKPKIELDPRTMGLDLRHTDPRKLLFARGSGKLTISDGQSVSAQPSVKGYDRGEERFDRAPFFLAGLPEILEAPKAVIGNCLSHWQNPITGRCPDCGQP